MVDGGEVKCEFQAQSSPAERSELRIPSNCALRMRTRTVKAQQSNVPRSQLVNKNIQRLEIPEMLSLSTGPIAAVTDLVRR